MIKILTIDGQKVPFMATASTVRRYRAKFHRDLLKDFTQLKTAYGTAISNNDDASGDVQIDLTSDMLEVFENLAYIMAKQADPSIPDDPDEWMDMFSVFPINEVFPEVVSLWAASMGQLEEPKKKQQ